jgi:malate dehydrogenase (oxaloacetate-decarboxylating)(NADP+)
MNDKLRESALLYHRHPRPGKIRIAPTKPLTTRQDLSLAYSPGVAAASELIHQSPEAVREVTARGNLVGVITDGSAVLGLGNIGPLAAKPVMEGKGVLFKKFADIDVFDIEISEQDPDKLIEIIAALEPTFGGINLEDIRAPGAFRIEKALKERLSIPVFHDDQHGTAIITAAAVLNALQIVGKKIGKVRLTASGAGAAGIACLDLLVKLGVRRENILVCDRAGLIYKGRLEDEDPEKLPYARETDMRTLEEAIVGADIFLGVSVGGVLTRDMVATMAGRPIILALANPDPEILPEDARAAAPDAIIATGRSDYPNQVNNVLCFPYIFRGALDACATCINDAMQMACVRALAELTHREVQQKEAFSYEDEALQFGPDYIIPRPFDPRLLSSVAPAVAQAAMDSGVARRPIEDMEAYRQALDAFVYRTGMLMKPVFDSARRCPKRVAYAEGEEPTVLRAVQSIVDNGLAHPILIGRPEVVERRIDHGAPRGFARYREDRRAHSDRRHRRPDGASRRRGRHDNGRGRALPQQTEARTGRHRPASGLSDSRFDERFDVRGKHALCLRYPRQFEPDRRAGGRDYIDGCGQNAHIRHETESGPVVALRLRQRKRPQRIQDEGGTGPAAEAGP